MNDQLRFRTMLVDLDKSLRPDELEQMKFLCYDIIPIRKREEITRGLFLWEFLEEQGLLSYDKTDFLKTLIQEAAGMREDLLIRVCQYEEKRVLPASQKTPDSDGKQLNKK